MKGGDVIMTKKEIAIRILISLFTIYLIVNIDITIHLMKW